MKAKPKLWPNGLGWNVGKNAEVWKFKDGLAVRVVLRNDRVKSLFISDHSLDPVAAVERCRREGQLVED